MLSVGEYRHHFVAFHHHYELVTQVWEVPVAAGGALEKTQDSFGFVTELPTLAPVPAHMEGQAEAVRDAVRAEGEAQGPVHVEYLGTYREVTLEELVVLDSGEEPGRELRASTWVVAADDGLLSLGEPVRYADWGSEILNRYDAHHLVEPPHWIDARPGRQGRAQLWNLMRHGAFPPEVRDDFVRAALQAAREVHAGQPGPALADLKTEQEQTALPADLDERKDFLFLAIARGVTGGTITPRASSSLRPDRAIGGGELASFHLSLPTTLRGELRLDATVSLSIEPPAAGGQGRCVLPGELAYEVTTSERGVPAWVGVAPVRVHAMIEGEHVHVLGMAGGSARHVFPPVAELGEVEVALGFQSDSPR